MTLGTQLAGKCQRLLRSISHHQACPDDIWAKGYLTEGEWLVYRDMDPRDREHACRVAAALLRDYPHSSSEVVAAALLHDSGKSVRPYCVIERVLLGLIPQALSPLLPPFGPLGVRASHPELGAELVARAGGRHRVAQLVLRHHASVGDPEARLLHLYDGLE